MIFASLPASSVMHSMPSGLTRITEPLMTGIGVTTSTSTGVAVFGQGLRNT